MKRLVLFFAAVAMAASVSAQTVTESKLSDNWYIGVNGGAATKISDQNGWLGGLNWNGGVRLGRWITPVFGLAVESNAYFANKPYGTNKTFVRYLNTMALATVNLSNWFGGYKGEPRPFEVVLLGGFGWGHVFGQPYFSIVERGEEFQIPTIVDYDSYINARYADEIRTNQNNITSKAAVDFVLNLGAKKAVQLYLEPAVLWGMNDWNYNLNNEEEGRDLVTDTHVADLGHSKFQFNKNKAYFQLNAGLVYKFKNSNGTHNFTIAELRDQAEIDALNDQINELRNRKPEVIEKVVEKIIEQPVKEISVNDLVFVTFAQGKSDLTKEAKAALDGVEAGRHVQIVGTASPEGPADLNQRLSEDRANVTADYLRARGVVVDDANGKGVQGVTSNRLAIVYVK